MVRGVDMWYGVDIMSEDITDNYVFVFIGGMWYGVDIVSEDITDNYVFVFIGGMWYGVDMWSTSCLRTSLTTTCLCL